MSMKNLMLICFIFSCNLLFAQVNTNAKIEFKQLVYDYGTIEKNSYGIARFVFYSKGSAPLVINNINASCGCTVPSWPKEPIIPGDSATIEVKYDTRRLGIISRHVTISCNASDENITLNLKGTVVETSNNSFPKKNIERNAMPFNN